MLQLSLYLIRSTAVPQASLVAKMHVPNANEALLICIQRLRLEPFDNANNLRHSVRNRDSACLVPTNTCRLSGTCDQSRIEIVPPRIQLGVSDAVDGNVQAHFTRTNGKMSTCNNRRVQRQHSGGCRSRERIKQERPVDAREHATAPIPGANILGKIGVTHLVKVGSIDFVSKLAREVEKIQA